MASAPSAQLQPQADGSLRLSLYGDWRQPLANEVGRQLLLKIDRLREGSAVRLDGHGLTAWGSALLVLLRQLEENAGRRQLALNWDGMPDGVGRLMALAHHNPEPDNGEPGHKGQLQRIGLRVIDRWRNFEAVAVFIGDLLLALGRVMVGKGRIRLKDVTEQMDLAGPKALGIVSLLSLLMGMILAFVGAIQLENFGATIYVASLVGFGMAREMAAMLTGIIMAGRTGAAYAAQLGSMEANEEIDALRTMGLPPMEFLVVPRILALMLMMPLLTLYSIAVGIIGGALVCWLMFDITLTQYMSQLTETVALRHFIIGTFKGMLFAVIVGVVGCMTGMASGRSASAVGAATTRAVVASIVAIICCDALVTLITTVMGV